MKSTYLSIFDTLANEMFRVNNTLRKWPPFNVVKVDENKYVIELAVAGFGKHDIDIILEYNKLIVNGNLKNDLDKNYVYKGIADRWFSQSFYLSDTMEVKSSELVNGMLKIFLENNIQEKKVKKINIETPDHPSVDTKQFLTE